MSGRDPRLRGQARITEVELDVVELAALAGCCDALIAQAALQGVALPGLGRVVADGASMALSVRPERWLLLTPPAGVGAAAARWQVACAGYGVAVDLSSGMSALRLEGEDSSLRAALARGCRLDLAPRVFPTGSAAATIIAQVSVILAGLADGMLLLTPSTTARHFREWLGEHV